MDNGFKEQLEVALDFSSGGMDQYTKAPSSLENHMVKVDWSMLRRLSLQDVGSF